MSTLTPRQIVSELDRYIIGQAEAKRAVAVALRNRYRRSQLPKELRDEVTPKNILMVGPTGVGKTEIARRLAKLVDAPFVKVEATKFTEVGYVGRDVDSIVRDLIEASIRLVKEEHIARVRQQAEQQAEEKLVSLIARPIKKAANPIDILLGNKPKEPELSSEERMLRDAKSSEVEQQLRAGKLEHTLVEVEVEEVMPKTEIPGMDVAVGDVLGSILPKKTKLRKVEVREARRILTADAEQNLIDMDAVYSEAIRRAEQDGIVFLDEIDKVAGKSSGHGPDVSREGVQRDILPIVEGSTVHTKYGPVETTHILFIAAGAFHVSKVTDLIPELQGRFPVRVNLKPLTREDYRSILVQPENALIRQYQALLKVDKVELLFEDSALDAIAEFAWVANENAENIGARRLHTVLESILNDIAFNAGGGDAPETEVRVDDSYVKRQLDEDYKEQDLKKYIL
ncbi:ATP-dependent protease ATPase subunit HslU [Bacillota bacterium Meth-B3]|nr:ATP-dependent protease ATPase subunit HslU [Christensenellaceae bacterium]MEA5064616.1 ATP-dependent protease ATPase subunit HslU [Eubacteriales bacterium]MEA5067474.1 ATP-dependent protease ATPase subunit HslU [Christensenellaceae bacterium]